MATHRYTKRVIISTSVHWTRSMDGCKTLIDQCAIVTLRSNWWQVRPENPFFFETEILTTKIFAAAGARTDIKNNEGRTALEVQPHLMDYYHEYWPYLEKLVAEKHKITATKFKKK
jgi:hypothetical protein